MVNIRDSTNVTLRDFTINGGAFGVFCGYSFCKFDGNTIQGASQASCFLEDGPATLRGIPAAWILIVSRSSPRR